MKKVISTVFNRELLDASLSACFYIEYKEYLYKNLHFNFLNLHVMLACIGEL